MPSAGELRERVHFGKREPSDDGYGNLRSSHFRVQFSRSARFLMRPGSEAVQAARLQGLQPVTMIVRFDSDTRQIETDWVAQDARTEVIYAIQSAEDMDRRRQWLTLSCVAGEVP